MKFDSMFVFGSDWIFPVPASYMRVGCRAAQEGCQALFKYVFNQSKALEKQTHTHQAIAHRSQMDIDAVQ